MSNVLPLAQRKNIRLIFGYRSVIVFLLWLLLLSFFAAGLFFALYALSYTAVKTRNEVYNNFLNIAQHKQVDKDSYEIFITDYLPDVAGYYRVDIGKSLNKIINLTKVSEIKLLSLEVSVIQDAQKTNKKVIAIHIYAEANDKEKIISFVDALKNSEFDGLDIAEVVASLKTASQGKIMFDVNLIDK